MRQSSDERAPAGLARLRRVRRTLLGRRRAEDVPRPSLDQQSRSAFPTSRRMLFMRGQDAEPAVAAAVLVDRPPHDRHRHAMAASARAPAPSSRARSVKNENRQSGRTRMVVALAERGRRAPARPQLSRGGVGHRTPFPPGSRPARSRRSHARHRRDFEHFDPAAVGDMGMAVGQGERVAETVRR